MPELDDERVEQGPDGVTRCVACGQPVDDLQSMDEAKLLEEIHMGTLRELARTLRSGNATHQELAVARGLLRDNKKLVAPDEDDMDPNLPAQGKAGVPPKREFPDYEHNE